MDDFGRQRIRPEDLLNRWIVPLESRVDYLTLHTGKKFQVPFDVLDRVCDEPGSQVARRRSVPSPYSVQDRHRGPVGRAVHADLRARLPPPRLAVSPGDGRVSAAPALPRRTAARMRSCQPRDILDQVTALCRYEGREPVITRELLDTACDAYFLDEPVASATGSKPRAAAAAEDSLMTLALHRDGSATLSRADSSAGCSWRWPRNLLDDYLRTGRLTGLLLLVSELLVAVLTMFRRRTLDVDRSAHGPGAHHRLGGGTAAAADVRAWAAWCRTRSRWRSRPWGLTIVVFGKLALGRSFGIVPANRGVVTRGPYRLRAPSDLYGLPDHAPRVSGRASARCATLSSSRSPTSRLSLGRSRKSRRWRKTIAYQAYCATCRVASGAGSVLRTCDGCHAEKRAIPGSHRDRRRAGTDQSGAAPRPAPSRSRSIRQARSCSRRAWPCTPPFMRFAIDVIFVDRAGCVRRVVRRLRAVAAGRVVPGTTRRSSWPPARSTHARCASAIGSIWRAAPASNPTPRSRRLVSPPSSVNTSPVMWRESPGEAKNTTCRTRAARRA